MRGRTVLRREAILLLRDISGYPEAALINFIFLRRLREPTDFDLEDYELYIKPESGRNSRSFIKRIIKKHGFKTKDGLDGFIVIYSPEKKSLLEIEV